MTTLASLSLNSQQLPALSVAPKKTGYDDSKSAASTPLADAPVVGVKVSLSSAGITQAAESKSAEPNKDIEESGLPDKVQKILKMIRELQKQIDEKQAELEALMADQTMNPETKRIKIGVLQTTLSTLSAGLMTASASLEKMTKNGTLTSEESQKAVSLLMKKSE